MGQRSQIYVKYNGELIIANYYQWNYGERMISRARYGIEKIKYYVDKKYDYVFKSTWEIESIRRYFDVNFDMKDIAMSMDIIKEYEDDKKYYPIFVQHSSFEEYVYFDQNNNDGKLLIDIRDGKIKYAFLDYDFSFDRIMDARQYMDWDYESWENSEYLSEEDIETCKDNIEKINEMAELMTVDEVKDFTTDQSIPLF